MTTRALDSVSRGWGILRHHGHRWLGARLLLEAQKRTGWEARTYAPRPWAANGQEWRRWVSGAWSGAEPTAVLAAWRQGDGSAWGRRRCGAAFATEQAASLGAAGRASLLASADEILAGRFTLFSRHRADTGCPPPWQSNPLTGGAVPVGARHWSHVPMRDPTAYGDLKLVWELSRCAWAFTLARAYAATLEERFAEGFWLLWLSWIDANPPHASVQWKCGQECALRLIAVTFAVEVLAAAKATTPERFVAHLGAVGALADRVHRGGWYAQLQDNNHSMSEGAGTYTAGVAYPMLAQSGVWREGGWRRLGSELERLVRPDGTFRQKSHNYHRLMLHVYLWATSLARECGDRLGASAEARLGAAVRYLEAIVDRVSGEAPNFGANDGALILPLVQAAYTDFLPTLLAGRRLVAHLEGSKGESIGVPSGSDVHGAADEMSLWLFGPARATTEERAAGAQPRPDLRGERPALSHRLEASGEAFPDGGIYTLHQTSSWIFTHAEHFRDRPGQADQLHVDLWWRGVNVARDAGTFMYYGAPALHAWFRGTACHNTVSVDGLDQMQPGPRFLWASRAQAQARVDRDRTGAPVSLWMAHDGYTRLSPSVSHERRVTSMGADTWLITDWLRGSVPRRYRLHWLLPDVPIRPDGDGIWVLETPAGPFYVQVVVDGRPDTVAFLRRAVEDPAAPWGWESRYYAERTPAQSLVVEVAGALETFTTVFSPRRPAATPPVDPFHGPGKTT